MRLSRHVALALLLSACAGVATAESLGRLFFSPLERQDMDAARLEPIEEKPQVTTGDQPRQTVVDVISFDGKVERSDGVSTVWVNGRAVYTGNRTAEGIELETSRGTRGQTKFVLPSSNGGSDSGKGPPPFELKVGEKVAVQNGRKFDAYEDRPAEDAENVLERSTPVESAPPPNSAPTTQRPPPPSGG